VSAPQIRFGGSPGYSGNFSGAILTNQAPTADPLLYLQEPSSAAQPKQTGKFNFKGNQIVTLNPGLYATTITIGGNAIVTMNPGLYYLQGGLSISGGGSLSGSGVTIYSDGGGALSMVGTGSLTLSPPSSGPYQGITIFQERSSGQTISVKGNGNNTNITGTFYAASAGLAIDGGGASVGSQYILSTLSLNGVPGTVNVPYSANNTAKTLVASLVF
jgi:hypothetical protein